MSFNNIGIGSKPDMPRIRHLMKLGLIAVLMVLVGDMLLGWGATAKSEQYAHRYRTRIIGSLAFGACGVHIPCCAVKALLDFYGFIRHGSSRTFAAESRKSIIFGMIGCLCFGIGDTGYWDMANPR